jgi:hypothetical protein
VARRYNRDSKGRFSSGGGAPTRGKGGLPKRRPSAHARAKARSPKFEDVTATQRFSRGGKPRKRFGRTAARMSSKRKKRTFGGVHDVRVFKIKRKS